MTFDYRSRAKLALHVLIALALLSQVYFATRNAPSHASALTSEIARYHQRFEGARRMLPPQGRVGYIGDTDNPLQDASPARRAFYLTQYVLSPIVVSSGTEPPLVIGNFRETGSLAIRLESKGLVLIKDFGDGVQLFRHREENHRPSPSPGNRSLPLK
jgi:hypothetical protein